MWFFYIFPEKFRHRHSTLVTIITRYRLNIYSGSPREKSGPLHCTFVDELRTTFLNCAINRDINCTPLTYDSLRAIWYVSRQSCITTVWLLKSKIYCRFLWCLVGNWGHRIRVYCMVKPSDNPCNHAMIYVNRASIDPMLAGSCRYRPGSGAVYLQG